MDDGAFSAGSRLLYWNARPRYFQCLSGLSGMQLGYWSWYEYMNVYHPLSQDASDLVLTDPMWGHVGFGSGVFFAYLAGFYARHYLRRVALSADGHTLEYTVHTRLGGETRVAQRLPLHTLTSKHDSKSLYSLGVDGQRAFLLLDRDGNFVDEQALVDAFEKGIAQSADTAPAASAATQERLEALAAEPRTHVQFDGSDYTQHGGSDLSADKVKAKGAVKGGPARRKKTRRRKRT
eukprot:g2602.t1